LPGSGRASGKQRVMKGFAALASARGGRCWMAARSSLFHKEARAGPGTPTESMFPPLVFGNGVFPARPHVKVPAFLAVATVAPPGFFLLQGGPHVHDR
jgi:hypothetical protein